MKLCNTTRLGLTAIIVGLFFSCAGPVRAQVGWVATRIGPAGKDLNTVYFLDSKRGWVAGDDGFLSRTDDGGQTWARQTVGAKDAINDIYFRTKEEGYLLAGNTIFVTHDSGNRWS